jgi:hypothetical protein
VTPAGGASRIEVYPVRGSVEVYSPGAGTEVLLRPLLGDFLAGEARVVLSDPVVLEEGLGPEVLVPPGTSRAFVFEAERKGKVGIGVRAQPGVAQCLLLGPDGSRLGSGPMQMAELEPGRYLLRVRAEASGPPLRVRAAVVGLRPPDTGPPRETLEMYLELAGGE